MANRTWINRVIRGDWLSGSTRCLTFSHWRQLTTISFVVAVYLTTHTHRRREISRDASSSVCTGKNIGPLPRYEKHAGDKRTKEILGRVSMNHESHHHMGTTNDRLLLVTNQWKKTRVTRALEPSSLLGYLMCTSLQLTTVGLRPIGREGGGESSVPWFWSWPWSNRYIRSRLIRRYR